MSLPKIIACGPPRSGGQSLQRAIDILTPGWQVWHSPGAHLGPALGNKWIAAVEVFAPVPWLEENYPGSYYISNTRDPADWLKSCASVYHKSTDWNNPLWKYPLSQFPVYREAYQRERLADLKRLAPGRHCVLNLVANPFWEPLCHFLGLPVPAVPFPRVDRVK